METRYVTLTTRVRGEVRMVSGGGVLCQPRVEAPSVQESGKVLDLEAYRRRLELEQPLEEEAPLEEPPISVPSVTWREKLGLALDVAATVAVLAAAAGMVLAMLGT